MLGISHASSLWPFLVHILEIQDTTVSEPIQVKWEATILLRMLDTGDSQLSFSMVWLSHLSHKQPLRGDDHSETHLLIILEVQETKAFLVSILKPFDVQVRFRHLKDAMRELILVNKKETKFIGLVLSRLHRLIVCKVNIIFYFLLSLFLVSQLCSDKNVEWNFLEWDLG
jgi:hypothetical protein